MLDRARTDAKLELDPTKLEYLKVWFAVFCAVIEPGEPPMSNDQIVEKLRQLREVIRRDSGI